MKSSFDEAKGEKNVVMHTPQHNSTYDNTSIQFTAHSHQQHTNASSNGVLISLQKENGF